MHNSNIPSDLEVPSTGKLIKSTIVAAVVAVVLLVVVVMPAEYGVDPTGVGSLIGLTRMGEIKMSLAEEAELDATTLALEEAVARAVSEAMANAATNPQVTAESEEPVETPLTEDSAPTNSHEMSVVLAPDQAAEIKVVMVEGAAVDYAWETDGEAANFDVHGDSSQLNISYHSYYKGTDQKGEGTLVAAFDGVHGWFWRNRSGETLTITINTSGEYSEIIRY